MSTFYDPGPLPGWPVRKPDGSKQTPVAGAKEKQSPSTATTGPGGAAPLPVTLGPRSADPAGAEARVRRLYEVTRTTAEALQTQETVNLRELYETLSSACRNLRDGDLGPEAVTIGEQFEAFFERMQRLISENSETTPTDSLGLPADAQFLNDMAEFIAQRFGV